MSNFITFYSTIFTWLLLGIFSEVKNLKSGFQVHLPSNSLIEGILQASFKNLSLEFWWFSGEWSVFFEVFLLFPFFLRSTMFGSSVSVDLPFQQYKPFNYNLILIFWRGVKKLCHFWKHFQILSYLLKKNKYQLLWVIELSFDIIRNNMK